MDVLRDRDVAISFGKSMREKLGDESLLKVYDQTLEPSEKEAADLVSKASKLALGVFGEVLKEHGVSVWKLLLTSSDPLPDLITEWHGEDKEVMQYYENFIVPKGYVAKKFRNPVCVGDPMKVINLVAIETGQLVSLAELHLNKDRPLAIIASSLS
ncbi:uncharacterized protein [Ptychodera flava]|uniref:uncharacterized protein n=1 Tax=Ptychodera flava TaxID=63121 RepID=UPI003969D993